MSHPGWRPTERAASEHQSALRKQNRPGRPAEEIPTTTGGLRMPADLGFERWKPAGPPEPSPPRGDRCHQPLDQAAEEGLPRLGAPPAEALSYWRPLLSRMPQCLYVGPGTGTPSGAQRGSGAATLSSPTAGAALRRSSTRAQVSRLSVVLAAVCAVLAQRTGYQECVIPVLATNESDPRQRAAAGPLVQSTILDVKVAGAGFDELARRAWAATVRANSSGRYDPRQRTEIARRVGYERGITLTPDPIFDNLTPDCAPGLLPDDRQSPDLPGSPSETELRWVTLPPTTSPFLFQLVGFEPVLGLSLVSGDTDRLGRSEMEALLLAVERLLVGGGPTDLAADRMREVIGLERVARGPEWMFVDSCWIEISAVQRLLSEAVAPAVARVFAHVAGRPLVAFLADGGPVTTPEQAHARCMELLPGRVTAMAPLHYVICDGAPVDPSDLDGWQRRRVRRGGSGRVGDLDDGR